MYLVDLHGDMDVLCQECQLFGHESAVRNVQKLLLWLDKTWSRIMLASLACGIGLFLGMGFLVGGVEEKIYEYRRAELQHMTDMALNTVRPILDRQKAGIISKEEALGEMRSLIRRMVFQDLFGYNYVFMSSYEGLMLVQPFEPSLEGTDQKDLRDAYGLPIIQELVKKAQEGGGYVTYYYHPPQRAAPQKKISYVTGIPELGVYIGSGMYVEDIRTSYNWFLSGLFGVAALVMALILGAQYIILRPMINSYRALTDAFVRLNRHFDPSERLSLQGYRRGSEAEKLLAGFNQLLKEIENKTESLRQSEKMFRTLFEFANDAIFVIQNGLIVDCNKRAELLFGLGRAELIGKRTEDLSPVYQQDGQTSRQKAKILIEGVLSGHSAVFEWRHIRHGEEVEMEVSLGRFSIEGRIFLLAIIRDISERKATELQLQEVHEELVANHEELERNNKDLQEREEQIRHMAYHDALTELPNRRCITERLRDVVEMAYSGQSQGAVLFFDLDHFKVINDSCGHAAGDQVLVTIANDMKAAFGAQYSVARFGGDEFIVLLEGVDESSVIDGFAGRLLRLLSKQVEFCGHSFSLSASIGIVQYPKDGCDVDELLKNADTALFAAKKSGRSTWKFYMPQMQETIVRRLNLEQHLREAVDNGEFVLHFQPIVDLDGVRIYGFEALLRWQHPRHGPIAPLTFIPIAEESGVIIPIGSWVLKNAALFGVKLLESGYDNLFVAVNISAKQLTHPDFVPTVKGILGQSGLPAKRLKLEITETALMDSVEDSVGKLVELRRLGIQIALDDFGIGYSSLTYLKKLPIHEVKIDKSFVDDLTSDDKTSGMMGSIISLSHQLGLAVVAEGVEREEQRWRLKDHQCDMIQGYLISRPVPEDEAISLLKSFKPSLRPNM